MNELMNINEYISLIMSISKKIGEKICEKICEQIYDIGNHTLSDVYLKNYVAFKKELEKNPLVINECGLYVGINRREYENYKITCIHHDKVIAKLNVLKSLLEKLIQSCDQCQLCQQSQHDQHGQHDQHDQQSHQSQSCIVILTIYENCNTILASQDFISQMKLINNMIWNYGIKGYNHFIYNHI